MKTIFYFSEDSTRKIKNLLVPLGAFLTLFFFTELMLAVTNPVSAASYANLSVSNFTFSPQTFYAGTHPATVSFRLTNNGPSSLSYPNSRVSNVIYLSRNDIFGDSDDIQIGTNSNDYALASSSYLDITLSSAEISNVTIPSTGSGSYYVFVSVQHASPSTLTDTIQSNNHAMRVGAIMVVNPATDADLAVSSFTLSPQTISAGGNPEVISFRLANNGPVNMDSPNTRVSFTVYLSRNSTFGDSDDFPAGTNSRDLIIESGSYLDIMMTTAETAHIVIPESAFGSYYAFIYVQHSSPSKLTDPTLFNSYAVRAGTITVVNTHADLAVTNLTFSPQTIVSGTNPSTVSFRLTNNGPADLTSPNTRVESLFYLSRNSSLGDADDILIGNNSYDLTLASSSFTDVNLSAANLSSITIPADASGNYYVFIRVQHGAPSVLTDPVATNNYVMRAGTLSVSNPSYQSDLAVSDLTFLPQSINTGTYPGSISFRLTNNGPASLMTPNVHVDGIYYLSANSTFGDSDDIQVGINSNDYTIPAASYTDVTLSAAERANLTIPSVPSGNYYLFLRVQHSYPSVLSDPTPGNDYVMTAGTINVVNTLMQADLAASGFLFTPQTISSGAHPDAVSFDLSNFGPANLAAPNTRVSGRYYLSRNDTFGDTDDILIGDHSNDYTIPSSSYISVSLSAAERANITIPSTASGSYYVFVRVQHAAPSVLTDPVLNNNQAIRIGTITVINTSYQADLAVSNLALLPQTIQAGAHPDYISFRLTNEGPTGLASPNTRVGEVFYLSTNNVFGDGDDIPIGAIGNDFTLPSASNIDISLSASDRANITIPTTAMGNYYVFITVQHIAPSAFTDPVTGNNHTLSAGTITVLNPNSDADIAVSSLTFLPQSVNPGANPDSVSFRLTNYGPGSLSYPNSFVDGDFYISRNGVFGDLDDIQIGHFNKNITLSPLLYTDIILSATDKAGITIPATASGDYYVFVSVGHSAPSLLTDPTPGNNHALMAGILKVIPPCNLSVSTARLDFSSSPGIKTVTLTSNSEWSVADNAEWIAVTPGSGSGNATLTVSVLQNVGTPRTGQIVITGCNDPVTVDVRQESLATQSIKNIQGEAYTSPYVGTFQRISGTVTGVVPGAGYFVQDAVTAWSGIYVADTYNFVLEGNGVTVDGTVQEVNGFTVINAAYVQLTNPPVAVTPILMGSPEEAKSEQFESVLVKIAGARFMGSPNQDGSWEIKTTENNKMTVDKLIYLYQPEDGHFYDVTGVIYGSGSYKIEPRKESDVRDLSKTTPAVALDDPQIRIYPNPFTEYLNIANCNKVARLTITNIAGQVEMDIAHPQSVVRTPALLSGIHLIRLYSDSGLIRTEKFVKK